MIKGIKTTCVAVIEHCVGSLRISNETLSLVENKLENDDSNKKTYTYTSRKPLSIQQDWNHPKRDLTKPERCKSWLDKQNRQLSGK